VNEGAGLVFGRRGRSEYVKTWLSDALVNN
jgi:hypothetical protein